MFVLEPKLIPFAQRVKAALGDVIVQEDGAAAHASQWQHKVFNTHEITRLIWPGNSPDLNMIEACWPWMKRRTSQHREFEQRGQLPDIWEECWEKLEQERIQHWIERIVRHIQEVIRLEGGNEYKEGAEERSRRFNWRQEAEKHQRSMEPVIVASTP